MAINALSALFSPTTQCTLSTWTGQERLPPTGFYDSPVVHRARRARCASGLQRKELQRSQESCYPPLSRMSPVTTSILLGLTAAFANVLGGAVIVKKEWDRRYLPYFIALGAGFMLGTA